MASGYVDRAKEREKDTADDREAKLKALEESLKKGELDREAYDKLRFEIAGGDLESTHLVKGLDLKLLARVRRGEDVYGGKKRTSGDSNEGSGPEDIDGEFDALQEVEVQRRETQATKKKGQLATVPVAAGKKRTRDQILAELKASREAAKAQQVSTLGSRFRKIGVKQKPGTRIERNSRGEEVLIIVDEDGHEKRKVRRTNRADEDRGSDLSMPDPKAKPLGMEVPEAFRNQGEAEDEEDESANIFDDVDDDYDPLAGLEASGSELSGDEDADADAGLAEERPEKAAAKSEREEGATAESSAREGGPRKDRNYFKDSKTGLLSTQTEQAPSLSDPAVLAAIKKAASLRRVGVEGEDDAKAKAEAAEERRRKLMQMSSRDEEDLDLGFGTSRLEDEDELEEQQQPRLSVWGEDGEGAEGGVRGGSSQRKRRPRKRKGDVNSAADVLRVMEERAKDKKK